MNPPPTPAVPNPTLSPPGQVVGRMQAVEIRRHGGPEVLDVGDRPVPRPGAGEALVRNAFIGLNFVDLHHRAGTAYPVELPLVPGTEATGVVVAVGEGVSANLLGRKVVHLGHLSGTYAEQTAVNLRHLVPLRDDALLDQVAAVGLAGTTAHVLVRVVADVQARIVVVYAAAGGTGGAVVQLALAEGACVIAVASTPERARVASRLGAHATIAVSDVDGFGGLADRLRMLTGGRGADYVFDATGADTYAASLRMLAPGGTLVVYGAATGHPAPFSVSDLSGLTGVPGLSGSLGVRWVSAGDYLTGGIREQAVTAVLADLDAGRLSPRIAAVMPLAEATRAHSLMAARSFTGKVLLRPPS
ncbi:MAG: zinc-binding dehydrogenase [Terracoccus sp.]